MFNIVISEYNITILKYNIPGRPCVRDLKNEINEENVKKMKNWTANLGRSGQFRGQQRNFFVDKQNPILKIALVAKV